MQKDFVKVMDVGQGDGILIYSNGYSALIDTGTLNAAADICKDIKAAGIESIDVVIITHPHSDHAGGLSIVSDRYEIHNLIIPKYNIYCEAASSIEEAKQDVIGNNGSVYTAVQGMNFKIGEFEITIIAYYPDETNENNQSVIVMAELGEKRFLFTGDAEANIESEMINEGLDLNCDVLKVGHHGSDTSSSNSFIKATTPDIAAISVGEGNQYSHPSEEVIDYFSKNDIDVYRTDTTGDIIFYIEDNKIRTETER